MSSQLPGSDGQLPEPAGHSAAPSGPPSQDDEQRRVPRHRHRAAADEPGIVVGPEAGSHGPAHAAAGGEEIGAPAAAANAEDAGAEQAGAENAGAGSAVPGVAPVPPPPAESVSAPAELTGTPVPPPPVESAASAESADVSEGAPTSDNVHASESAPSSDSAPTAEIPVVSAPLPTPAPAPQPNVAVPVSQYVAAPVPQPAPGSAGQPPRVPAGHTQTFQEPDRQKKAGAVRVAQKSSSSTSARVIGVIGELLITAGIIVGLYIVWSLWWTDVMADFAQRDQVAEAQKSWVDNSGKIGTPRTDAPPAVDHPTDVGALEGLVYIPKFGPSGVHTLKQGVDLEKVLDTGSFGHYPHTQYAGENGNFAISAHRQTYGAALRDVDKLQPGDAIVIQTPKAFFVYHVVKHEIVSPTTVRVLDPDPFHPGQPANGRYLTMTTCHPPFISDMRWITYAQLDHWVDPTTGIPQEIKGMGVN